MRNPAHPFFHEETRNIRVTISGLDLPAPLPGLADLLQQVFHRRFFWSEFEFVYNPLSITHPKDLEYELLEVV